ncbi:MAG: right-handed parallel beta-helix repeat-containing protein [Lentisphaeria bacterium]|nr:right-handed parallel beta-helix repeat-containing protein [Lentisphaeria bacterium]
MMNALFLKKHTAGDRIDLPAIVNTSAVLDSQYSHCTINGNNTVWTAGTDVVFLNDEKDEIWQGSLPQGHTFLYRNGENIPRSRWPEHDFLQCDKWEKQWDEEKKIFTTNRLHLSIPEEVRRELTGATAVLYFDWLNIRFSVTDTAETYVDLQKVSKYKFGSDCCKVCFENVSVKYLTPGKWLPIPEKGIFYYKPLPGETFNNAAFMTSGTETLLTLDHAENIVFENITFSSNGDTMKSNAGQADVTGTAAIQLRFSKNCVFRNCKFINLARWGILIADGCSNIRLENCIFENLGSGAIRIQGNENGSDEMYATTGVTVESCQIRHGGKLWAGCSAITIKHAAKNRITNCDISYFPYTGISCGWTWGYKPSPAHHNIIKGNHVHHLGEQKLVLDMGAIYVLGNQPGTEITDNVIHDIDGKYATWGIYLDEGSSNMHISGNIVFRCKNAPFHVHFGKNNVVKHNLFAGGPRGACVSYTRGTMDFKQFFVPGDKTCDLTENLCLANGMPFYLKYILDIEGKQEFTDCWQGKNNLCIQLDPACSAKFADDFHIFQWTYNAVPEEKFLADGRETGTQFFHGTIPKPGTFPDILKKLYEKYLTLQ